jgi:hypothetical protein
VERDEVRLECLKLALLMNRVTAEVLDIAKQFETYILDKQPSEASEKAKPSHGKKADKSAIFT